MKAVSMRAQIDYFTQVPVTKGEQDHNDAWALQEIGY
jgi:hypothetical protein